MNCIPQNVVTKLPFYKSKAEIYVVIIESRSTFESSFDRNLLCMVNEMF